MFLGIVTVCKQETRGQRLRGRFIVHVRGVQPEADRVSRGHGQTELGHGRIWTWESKKGATDQETGKIAKRTSVPQMTRLYREEQLEKGQPALVWRSLG